MSTNPLVAVIGILIIWNLALNYLLLRQRGELKPMKKPEKEVVEKKPAFFHGVTTGKR